MDSALSTAPANLRKAKRDALLISLGVGFVEGIADYFVQGLAGEGLYQFFSIATMLLNLVLIIRWFVLDAREREFRLSKNWFLAFVILLGAAAPVYFVKTRGAGFWKPLILSVLFVFALGACYGLGNLLGELLGVAA